VRGWLGVLLGVLDIFLPVLPTTPFLLLATACLMLSSPRFYYWLIDHSYLGSWIHGYLDGKGIPWRAKVYAIVLMWSSIALSCYLLPFIWARILMLISAILVTRYILRQKNLPSVGL
jgi:uncharacterized membrane protein YbaN (DUF454 family)